MSGCRPVHFDKSFVDDLVFIYKNNIPPFFHSGHENKASQSVHWADPNDGLQLKIRQFSGHC